MTLVGKIFTMLIFVMSLVFMAFSIMVFATHTDWKKQADDLKIKLTQQEQALDRANKDHETTKLGLAQEQAARRHALAVAQTRLVQAEMQLQTQATLLAQKESQLSETTVGLTSAEKRLADLQAEVAAARSQLKLAQQERDDIYVKIVEATDKYNQSESLREQLETRNTQLVAQAADMERVMKANGLTVDSLVSHITPKVEGIVMDVSGTDLVEISIGHDDGLKEGHTLDVYRGSSYLGRIIIRKTAPDRAVGQVVKELKRGQIKKGDHVTSKLS